MKKEVRKQLIILSCILVPLIGFITYGLLITSQEDKLLEKEAVYTTAIIADTYVGTKARHFVRYEFVVNDKVYDGHQNYMPHREFVIIGDTCEVVYAESNPEISRLLTDDNDFLKIKRKDKELKFLPK